MSTMSTSAVIPAGQKSTIRWNSHMDEAVMDLYRWLLVNNCKVQKCFVNPDNTVSVYVHFKDAILIDILRPRR